MITLNTDNYKNFSQNTYNILISEIQFNRLTCPCCGHKGCFSIHGYYERSLKTSGGKTVLTILRIKCEFCGSTHALLPSYIVPYSQSSLSDHVEVIDAFEGNEKTAAVLKHNSSIDESTLRYIIRQYLKHWRQKLLSVSLKTSPLNSLTKHCFSFFKRHFMQIKSTSNILFSKTT